MESEIISQIHKAASFISLIGISERNLQWTENTVHTISGTDTKQLFPFQYFEEVTVRQTVVACQGEVMNTSHTLPELQRSNDNRIFH